MQRKAKNPRNDHFVPRSYLTRFSDTSGFLHVYDRTSGQWRWQRPTKLMRQSFYYRQEWTPVGVDPNVFEKTLGSWLENDAKNSIDCLISEPSSLTEQDVAVLLLYLEIQRIRVPRQAAMAEMLMLHTLLRLAPSDIGADIRSGEFQLVINKSARFDYMRTMVGQLHPWFASMDWEVIEAEKGSSFITTDSPLSLYNAGCLPPTEPGIALAGTVVLFPLSSTHLLLMRHPQCLRGPNTDRLKVLPNPLHTNWLIAISNGAVWSRDAIRRHNSVMFKLADRIVAGESKQILQEAIS